ncbi:MAG: hypothetical protein AAF198_06840 [Pseudomonadota bacterium]
MPAEAIVVLCPSRPDLLGQPLLGHVGWGFELPNGEWVIGAIEGDGWENGNGFNGFWSERRLNLNAALQHFSTMINYGAEYNQFKLLRVAQNIAANPQGALEMMGWLSQQHYKLVDGNCMDATYRVLKTFSRGGYFHGQELPSPDFNWIPNGWYNAIQVPQNDHQNLPYVGGMRNAGAFCVKVDPLEGVKAIGPDVPAEEALPKRSASGISFEAVDVPKPGNRD